MKPAEASGDYFAELADCRKLRPTQKKPCSFPRTELIFFFPSFTSTA